nr:substrate-binding domain-containing protein [Bifidobacterium pongonis]
MRSQGHKTLAYVSQPVNASPFICSDSVRERGFLQAATECGYGDGDIITIPSLRTAGGQSEQDVYSGIVAQLLSAVRRPTGICVSNDAAAVPLIKEMRRVGWQVPQDTSVIGFDDDPSAAIADLTTVHQNPVETGREAARKALALMNGQTLEEPFTFMPTSLVLRGTTEHMSR